MGVMVMAFGLMPTIAQEKKATPVKVDAVRMSPYTQTIPLIGRFVARQQGDVATRVSGAVAKINVEVGDRVSKGDIIASLIDDRLQWQRSLQRAEVSNSTARVETSKARLTLLQKELKRISSLKKSPAFSQARLDDKEQQILVASSELVEAEANLRKARATLNLTDIDYKDAKIRAPFDGVVSQKHTSAGSYLNVGTKVVTLIDDRTLEIEADVPSSRILGLQSGTEVAGIFGQDAAVMTTVRAIVPEENPQTRTRAVRFSPILPDGQEGLAANQSITLYLPHGAKKNVLSVHKDAILNRRGMKLVIVPTNGQVAFRPVTLGDAVGNRFVVLKGLKEGEVVVTRGNERLRPKQVISYDGQPNAEAGAKTKNEG
jgi:RND family efflux transporter MFP subunit